MAKKAATKVKEKPVTKQEEKTSEEITIEKRLIALYTLQQIDSQIDKIRIVRGELPLEVQDLEDEVAGLETRINNYKEETESLKKQVSDKENAIKESEAMIKKYEKQQMNVRNNREYDSLSKEIEFQTLEIQLNEKRIKETNFKLDTIKEEIEKSNEDLTERKNDLAAKKGELDDIVADTEKEEKDLITKSEKNQDFIEDRLLTAYQRIRKNARNGLAVVKIERDACGGCFNKIPPQSQLDIRMHKKIIVCEYCGRILVDEDIVKTVNKDN
jgi:predicted  nucleic acid-binding Zn-ribbon protein